MGSPSYFGHEERQCCRLLLLSKLILPWNNKPEQRLTLRLPTPTLSFCLVLRLQSGVSTKGHFVKGLVLSLNGTVGT